MEALAAIAEVATIILGITTFLVLGAAMAAGFIIGRVIEPPVDQSCRDCDFTTPFYAIDPNSDDGVIVTRECRVCGHVSTEIITVPVPSVREVLITANDPPPDRL